MTDWRERLGNAQSESLRRTRVPRWSEPMLATLTAERFSSPDWIYERKLGCLRCLVFRRQGGIEMYTRNRNTLNETYPELESALLEQPCEHFICDGEIVAFKGNNTNFSRLQGRSVIRDHEQARASGIKV